MIGIAVIALIAGFVFIIRPDAASSTLKSVSSDVNRPDMGGPDDFGPPPDMGGPNDFGPPPDMGGPNDFGSPQYNKYFSHYLN